MNKTIKKIVALGMGATMLAGTAAMALATDLSNYPSPFVKDGVFVGKIVIGEKAASVDVIGAMDIAASLQRASAVAVAGAGSTSTASAADGYKFHENTPLFLGANLSSVGISIIDDTNLPVLLQSGTLEADSGTAYDYTTDVRVGASTGVVSATVGVDSDIGDAYQNKDPVVFFDMTGGKVAYQTVIDFKTNINLTSMTHSETIDLFGQTYTLASDNTNTKVTLYGSQTTLLVAKGTKETVTYGGKDYTVEVLGGNSGDSSAIVRINGDTRTVKESNSKTIGGLPVYVKNVFVSNIGGDDVSVQLFVGSNKLELNAITGVVTLNGVDLNEVSFATDSAAYFGNLNTMTFTVAPSNGRDAGEVKYLLPGQSYVDPVFGAFKLNFVGATDLTAGKEPLTFVKAGRKMQLTFQAQDAPNPTTIALYESNANQSDLVVAPTLGNLTKDDTFIWNGGIGTATKTHILKVKSVTLGNDTANTDFEVQVDDLSYGKTYDITGPSKAMDSDIGLYASNLSTDRNHVTFSTSPNNGVQATYGGSADKLAIYTQNGAKVNIQYNFNNTGWTNATSGLNFTGGDSTNGTGLSAVRFLVTEDYKGNKKSSTPTSFVVTDSWSTTDTEYHMNVVGPGSQIGNNDNVDYYLTQWGTFIEKDTNTGLGFIKAYIPAMEVGYDMFLLPVASDVTVSTASTTGAVALNPISVGMAILDSDATLGSKPYIVVGGPCANTVAAALMGNPAEGHCADGFTEGKAMIKLFSDKNALLVAGNSGQDTQGASRVLANYNNPAYALTGTEVEVVTANLQSLSVKSISN